MSGISMSYDISVHISVIYLSCDTNLFSNKTHVSIISSGYMARHPSKLPIQAMSLYICGDYFPKSYTAIKTAVVYDKYKPKICLVYANIFMFFDQLCFY